MCQPSSCICTTCTTNNKQYPLTKPQLIISTDLSDVLHYAVQHFNSYTYLHYFRAYFSYLLCAVSAGNTIYHYHIPFRGGERYSIPNALNLKK